MSNHRFVVRFLGTLLVTALFLGSSPMVGLERLHAAPAMEAASAQRAGGLVNINTASLEELQAVRGIGPTIAERIVDYRAAHGPFESLKDLTMVRGIGGAKFQRVKAQIKI